MKIDKRKLCSGCYNECYWHGTGGAKECWSFDSAEIVDKLMIHVDRRPPYDKSDTVKTLSCYRKQRYVMVSPDAIREDGYWKT